MRTASLGSKGVPVSHTGRRPILGPQKLVTGSFDTVIIDRPGSQSHKLHSDPNFIRAWAGGVILVRPGKLRELHPEVKSCLARYHLGWYIVRRCTSLRVARFLAGVGISYPSRVQSIWGNSLRELAKNTPNQLFWLRSSWKLFWVSPDPPPGRDNGPSLIDDWSSQTKTRLRLGSTIRTSIRAKHGLGLICGNESLPEIRSSICSLTCYGSRPGNWESIPSADH